MQFEPVSYLQLVIRRQLKQQPEFIERNFKTRIILQSRGHPCRNFKPLRIRHSGHAMHPPLLTQVCYYPNHGLPANPADESDPVCRRALELAVAALAKAKGTP